MNNQELFSEVFADLTMKIGEDKAKEAFKAYDYMETSIKFSNADLLTCSELEQLAWPKTAGQFKQLLTVVKCFLSKSSQTNAVEAVDNVLAFIPDVVQASTVQEQQEGEEPELVVQSRKIRPKTEPNADILRKVVTDYLKMNGLDAQVRSDIDKSIEYHADRIFKNEFRVSAEGGIDRDKALALARRKLAAYYNLQAGCPNDKIKSPEIVCKGNRAMLEVSLYNSFIVSIVGTIGKWKNRVFASIDTDAIVKRSQYSYVYDAIASSISEIVVSRMEEFVDECVKDEKKNPYELTEPEKVALDELYLSLLGKKMPMCLR